MAIEKLEFGRTGHLRTRTLFGEAAFGGVTQVEADETMELLIKYGVNHIDTAASYGDSEIRLGPWMKTHRQQFFLATKVHERKGEEAESSILRSAWDSAGGSPRPRRAHPVSGSMAVFCAMTPGAPPASSPAPTV